MRAVCCVHGQCNKEEDAREDLFYFVAVRSSLQLAATSSSCVHCRLQFLLLAAACIALHCMRVMIRFLREEEDEIDDDEKPIIYLHWSSSFDRIAHLPFPRTARDMHMHIAMHDACHALLQ